MGYGIRLKVWGKYACFTRPEAKAERVSYEVITPSAARGILSSIYTHPNMRWVIDRLHVLNEIKTDSIRTNEVAHKISVSKVIQAMKTHDLSELYLVPYAPSERVQRTNLLLRDVAYVIEAHFELTKKEVPDDEKKRYAIFCERAKMGRYYRPPCFGCEQYPAHFELLEENVPVPQSFYRGTVHDLGWMVYDTNYLTKTVSYYKAVMVDGVIDVLQCARECGCSS